MCRLQLCAMAKPARLNAVRTGVKAFGKYRPVLIDFGIGLPTDYNRYKIRLSSHFTTSYWEYFSIAAIFIRINKQVVENDAIHKLKLQV